MNNKFTIFKIKLFNFKKIRTRHKLIKNKKIYHKFMKNLIQDQKVNMIKKILLYQDFKKPKKIIL